MYDMKKYDEKLEESEVKNAEENEENQAGENEGAQGNQEDAGEDVNLDGIDDIPLDEEQGQEEEVEIVDKLKPAVKAYND